MKVGVRKAIEAEVNMYDMIHQFGFPLPKLLEYRMMYQKYYIIFNTSLGLLLMAFFVIIDLKILFNF